MLLRHEATRMATPHTRASFGESDIQITDYAQQGHFFSDNVLFKNV